MTGLGVALLTLCGYMLAGWWGALAAFIIGVCWPQ